MIGLGKMGGSMARRLVQGGHSVVGYARDEGSLRRLAEAGGRISDSLEDLAGKMRPPRAIWMMIPAGDPVERTIEGLVPHLTQGDVVIDGGNSYYKDTMRRAAELAKRGIHYVDVGTSGGVWGLTEGYSMMVGGEKEVVERLRPVFEALAPAPDRGWGRVGGSGAGHFVKMIHNGIEYGLMEAYAEGFAIMRRKAEFGLDLEQVAEIWRYGSVVRSWLLDLVAKALAQDPSLESVAPYVEDSGEGRWTVWESVDLDVAAPVITLSLLQRLRSRDEEGFSDRLLAALRREFGGHGIKEA